MKKFESLKFPSIGFGTWRLTGKTCQAATEYAIQVGYRLIDTADIYGNHKEVGLAIKNSGLKRNQLFLTTKVWFTDLTYKGTIAAAKRFLRELDTEYLDLLLIHWPNPRIVLKNTFAAFEDLEKEKVIRKFGVSNFTINHIKDALKISKPFTNQVEFHPTLNQKDLKRFCDKEKIKITAYSPLGLGKDLKNEIITSLSDKYGKPPSQVVLNWIIQKGITAIPRSSKKEHIKDNFESTLWKLSESDIKKIDGINGNERMTNPIFANFDY